MYSLTLHTTSTSPTALHASPTDHPTDKWPTDKWPTDTWPTA